MDPTWLTVLALTALVAWAACAVAVLADIYLADQRQKTPIMEVVWPTNAPHLSPPAV